MYSYCHDRCTAVLAELLQPAQLPSDALTAAPTLPTSAVASNANDTSSSSSGRFVLITPCTAGQLSSDDAAVAQLLAHEFEVYMNN